jgi:hypothetical protein
MVSLSFWHGHGGFTQCSQTFTKGYMVHASTSYYYALRPTVALVLRPLRFLLFDPIPNL